MSERMLVFGAGAIGSIFAGKLLKAGYPVTILARGARYEEIKAKGLVLKDAMSGKVERYAPDCIDRLAEDDLYDYVLVAVQNQQVGEVLESLRGNRSRNIVFVVNNPLGYATYAAALGKERVMIGFPSAGGERKDGIVTYFIGTGLARALQSTTFGELDGGDSARLEALLRVFRRAGFEPAKSADMDSWQKTHVAFVLPIAYALYKFGSDNYRLAKSGATIRAMILATREGFRALREIGTSVTPRKLNFYYAPAWLLVLFYKALFRTRIAEFSMAKHTIVARREIEALEGQFRGLCPGAGFASWDALRAGRDRA